MKHNRLGRLRASAAVAALGCIGATAISVADLTGNAAAAPPPLIPAVDCSQTYGGNYLATIDGQVNGYGSQATVTLGANCTGTPYYIAVYEASDNLWGGGAYPNSQESFPEPQDFPEYIYPQSPTEKYVTFASATPGGPLTATVNLPNSCWQLDIFSFASVAGTIPDSFTTAAGLGFPPGIWGENGPFTIATDGTATPNQCTPGGSTTTTTTTTSSTTTTTAPTTTTTAPTTTTTASTTTTTASTTTTTASTTTTTMPPATSSPLTIGYWKHWNSYVVGTTSHAPIMDTYLPQSLGNYEVTTAEQGVAVLRDSSAKYAENSMAAQLLAAELDLAAGATSCPAVTTAISQANALLQKIGYAGPPSAVVGSSSSLRTEFISTASTLDEYNNNNLC